MHLCAECDVETANSPNVPGCGAVEDVDDTADLETVDDELAKKGPMRGRGGECVADVVAGDPATTALANTRPAIVEVGTMADVCVARASAVALARAADVPESIASNSPFDRPHVLSKMVARDGDPKGYSLLPAVAHPARSRESVERRVRGLLGLPPERSRAASPPEEGGRPAERSRPTRPTPETRR